jgi:nucleoside recognition membrane protein YjiH
MRKGYVFILIFSFFVAISQTLKYRIYIKHDWGAVNQIKIGLQMMILFLIILIPGLLLVRWYYKLKDK